MYANYEYSNIKKKYLKGHGKSHKAFIAKLFLARFSIIRF